MIRYDDTVTIKTVFGTAKIVFIPEYTIPETTCPAGIFGTTPARVAGSRYVATFIDGDYENVIDGQFEGGHQGAFEDLIAKASRLYALKAFKLHVTDQPGQDSQPVISRHVAVIADGSALWLDADGNKLPQRKFTDDEIAVKFDLSQPVTRERCAALCATYNVKVMCLGDWRFFHPVTGQELDAGYMELHGDEGGYRSEKTTYIYFADSDTLQVWQDGIPVSEDVAGIVCDDRDALADTLL